MIVELQRQWVPALELAQDGADACCGLCGLAELSSPRGSFAGLDLSVVAYARTDDGADMGTVCLSCVEYLGKRNTKYFPTIEEYRELLERYPEPMYPNLDALEHAGEEEGYLDPSEIAASSSLLWTREVDREGGFTLEGRARPIYLDKE
jgi:hypothetical protein